jgi:hypothetical protein
LKGVIKNLASGGKVFFGGVGWGRFFRYVNFLVILTYVDCSTEFFSSKLLINEDSDNG